MFQTYINTPSRMLKEDSLSTSTGFASTPSATKLDSLYGRTLRDINGPNRRDRNDRDTRLQPQAGAGIQAALLPGPVQTQHKAT